MLLQLSQFNKIKSPTQKRETKHLFVCFSMMSQKKQKNTRGNWCQVR